MKLHSWQLTPSEAVALQKKLRNKLKLQTLDFSKIKHILAVDASYLLKEDKVLAVAAVFTYPDQKLVTYESVLAEVKFPYIPGLLSFREGPVVLQAVTKLSVPYNVVLVDGQGFAHPRRFGLASHLGLWLNSPTVGVGKTVLVGHYHEPADEKGSQSPLLDNNEVIGMVLRTQTNVKPIFVSVGHLVDLASSVQLCLSCTTKYRLPEPLRQVDLLTKKLRQENTVSRR